MPPPAYCQNSNTPCSIVRVDSIPHLVQPDMHASMPRYGSPSHLPVHGTRIFVHIRGDPRERTSTHGRLYGLTVQYEDAEAALNL